MVKGGSLTWQKENLERSILGFFFLLFSDLLNNFNKLVKRILGKM